MTMRRYRKRPCRNSQLQLRNPRKYADPPLWRVDLDGRRRRHTLTPTAADHVVPDDVITGRRHPTLARTPTLR